MEAIIGISYLITGIVVTALLDRWYYPRSCSSNIDLVEFIFSILLWPILAMELLYRIIRGR